MRKNAIAYGSTGPAPEIAERDEHESIRKSLEVSREQLKHSERIEEVRDWWRSELEKAFGDATEEARDSLATLDRMDQSIRAQLSTLDADDLRSEEIERRLSQELMRMRQALIADMSRRIHGQDEAKEGGPDAEAIAEYEDDDLRRDIPFTDAREWEGDGRITDEEIIDARTPEERVADLHGTFAFSIQSLMRYRDVDPERMAQDVRDAAEAIDERVRFVADAARRTDEVPRPKLKYA